MEIKTENKMFMTFDFFEENITLHHVDKVESTSDGLTFHMTHSKSGEKFKMTFTIETEKLKKLIKEKVEEAGKKIE